MSIRHFDESSKCYGRGEFIPDELVKRHNLQLLKSTA